MVYGTDGGIVAANLQILEDDRHDQPVYAPVPIIREAVLKANPQIARIVQPVMESFSRETLQQLNARVQINGESESSVAEDYLKAKGFLK
jgi:osmoprotectant transport system substrate-binding protein